METVMTKQKSKTIEYMAIVLVQQLFSYLFWTIGFKHFRWLLLISTFKFEIQIENCCDRYRETICCHLLIANSHERLSDKWIGDNWNFLGNSNCRINHTSGKVLITSMKSQASMSIKCCQEIKKLELVNNEISVYMASQAGVKALKTPRL